MPDWRRTLRAVSDEDLDRMREGLLSSRFVGDSPLTGSFRGSRGFAAVFTRDGISELRARWPFLEPWVELVLDEDIGRGLLPWPQRLLGRRPVRANAFYLNLLLLGPGDDVGPHVDATLRDVSGVDDALPELVSVVYLRTPDVNDGGELILWRGAEPLGGMRPVEGSLVLFAGHLKHAVRAFASDDEEALRASFVCEQYALDEEGLARVPRFRLHTQSGFSAYVGDDDATRGSTATSHAAT
jgi:hypothetical protein